jgi:UDP-N-acetylmuramyl pentapeptide phosphotransferase/UDP-N-acetylglucosamine-1-phosphate transferase
MDLSALEGLAGVFLLAVALAILGTRLVEQIARRLDLLDVPNARSSHAEPTPRLGGIAVMAATLLAWAVAGGSDSADVWVVIGAALALAAVGLIDDFRPLASVLRLALQVAVAAGIVVVSGPVIDVDLPGIEVRLDGLLGQVVVAIFIVAVINAVNFMDGIDGMAAGVAVVNVLALTALAEPEVALLLVALGGASVGFLAWNHHPASIFLGDSGSLFIGTTLVGAAVLGSGTGGGSQPVGGSVAAIPTLLIFLPFLYDTGLTILRRALRGESLLVAHRSHLYQRLARVDGHRPVANLYVCAAALSGLGAIVYRFATDTAQLGVLIAAVLLVVGVAVLVDLRTPANEPNQPGADPQA